LKNSRLWVHRTGGERWRREGRTGEENGGEREGRTEEGGNSDGIPVFRGDINAALECVIEKLKTLDA
jgi:hypothetical protein